MHRSKFLINYLGKVLTILHKDILSEFRNKEIISSVLVFAILVIVIFNFAFESDSDTIGMAAPGVLWVTFTFAGVLSLGRAFVMEKEQGCLEGLMLCPVSRDVLYWGKMISSMVFMIIIEAIVFPVFLIIFDLPLWMPRLVLIAILGTLGFAAVGTLFSALAANTKARDMALPVIFFPSVIPVIIASVKATDLVLNGGTWDEMSSWLGILIAFDVIFLVVSALVFEYVIEE